MKLVSLLAIATIALAHHLFIGPSGNHFRLLTLRSGPVFNHLMENGDKLLMEVISELSKSVVSKIIISDIARFVCDVRRMVRSHFQNSNHLNPSRRRHAME